MKQMVQTFVAAFYATLAVGVLVEALWGRGRSFPQRFVAASLFAVGMYGMLAVTFAAVTAGLHHAVGFAVGYVALVALVRWGRVGLRGTCRVRALVTRAFEGRRGLSVQAVTSGGLVFWGEWPYGEEARRLEPGERVWVDLTVSTLTGFPLHAVVLSKIPQLAAPE